jgi:hypothetical protein
MDSNPNKHAAAAPADTDAQQTAPNADAAPVASPNWAPTIRAMMQSEKRRGNVKDFVVIAHHGMIYDHDRTWQVRAQLPAELQPGWRVFVFDRDGNLAMMHVVRDEGENLWLSAGHGEHKVPRSECYPTGIPRAPKLVHKSQLRSYVGERWAALFWHQKLGRRVTNPGKAKVH